MSSGVELTTTTSQSQTQASTQSEDELTPTQPQQIKQCGHIRQLEINNFKSYGNNVIIGPFKKFTCIVGPNGSGKSNLMDAISFVLGVHSQKLRGRKLSDLIHRGSPDSSQQIESASVRIVYETVDGEIIAFRREITINSTTNNYVKKGTNREEKVSFSQYSKELAEIGVIVKARNFLVFQGDVETIAQKSGKQLTEWVEQVSGSIDLKDEFEIKQEERDKLQRELEDMVDAGKNLTREKKQMKLQKEEAMEYQQKEIHLREIKKEFYTYKIWHHKNSNENASKEIRKYEQQIETATENIQNENDNAKVKQGACNTTQKLSGSYCQSCVIALIFYTT